MKPNLDLTFWLYKSKSLTTYVFNKPYAIYLPTRAEVLQQLGISKEQDNINQELWKSL